jgi:hypothetical protein
MYICFDDMTTRKHFLWKIKMYNSWAVEDIFEEDYKKIFINRELFY